MRRFRRENLLAVLASAVCLITVISLTEWPRSWLGVGCLVPVILAGFLLDTWELAGAGALALLLPKFFGSVIWIPPAATILMIVSLAGLVQARQSRKIIRQKEMQYQ